MSAQGKYSVSSEQIRGERRWYFALEDTGKPPFVEHHEFGSNDRRVVERRVARLNSGHSAPPAEPATIECGEGSRAYDAHKYRILRESLRKLSEAQVASPQEAREWLDSQECEDRSPDKTFYKISAQNLSGLLQRYAAHERKLRVEAEQERDKLKTLTIAGQFKTLATEHELRLDAESKLAAAEARLAQIEQERSGK